MNINDVIAGALKQYLSCLGVFQRNIPGGAEITLLGSACKCLVDVSDLKEGNGGFSAAANVSIVLAGSGCVVEDLVIGYGATPAETVINAIDQFVGSMVAPIAGLSSNFDLDKWRCTVNNFELPGARGNVGWNMVVGQIVSNDAVGDLYDLADSRPPMFDVFDPIAQYICDSHKLNPHWVKLYLCRYPDGIDGEVQIDNQLHEQAYNLLRNFSWPTNQEFIWFRQFAILEPADETERRMFSAPQEKRQSVPNAHGKVASFFSNLLKGPR